MTEHEKILAKFMEKDAILKLFGIKPEIIGPGQAKAVMTVDERMVNGQNITHGAALFALCDIAFAVAANSRNRVALALNMNMNFLKPTFLGDLLTATATEEKLNRTTALYRIAVEDGKGSLVALAQGLVYRMQEQHFIEE